MKLFKLTQLIFLFFYLPNLVFAQKTTVKADKSIVSGIPFTNIGPSIMSGRVVDLDVNPEMPSEFYVAYASGGLWYTHNNGTSFEPVMDSAPTITIGDIAVDWKNHIIWVGTGENNSSRSSYAGKGIFKSTDKGKTWEFAGLPKSQHIGRIILNPNNKEEVIIGVAGNLYTPNNERGIYKTTDGGATWKKTLFIDNTTGIIDVAVVPDSTNILYAAAWQKDRKAWNFNGNGLQSGIYKSTDSGESWKKITTSSSGFPTGEGVGRIGLAVVDSQTLYAVHDNQFRRPKEKKDKADGLNKEDFKKMTVKEFLALDNKNLDTFLKKNNFQEKYRAENIKQLVRADSLAPVALATYLEDANSLLFDTPVIGAEVYKSTDAGKTWKKMNKEYIDDVFNSYGYYFAQIRVSPSNPDRIYIMGVPILTSDNGGVSFTSISKENVHADHHALWINPKNPNHLINGNDGGVNISYDNGEHWLKANQPAVGQFYSITVDNQKPYHVYGGLQDNGVWTAPVTVKQDFDWHQSGEYPWKSIMGGDGMQVQVDSRDASIVYTGYQFGNYYRIDRKTGKQTYIQPKHELGKTPYRFNWQTPILLSPHNQDILYMGANKLMRSMNKGTDWTEISSDLTNGGKKGNVAYGTITTISESPFTFGLLYTGSDDGLIQVSKDAGASWKIITSSLPRNLWISRVVASAHQKSRVYASLNGYRNDDFTPYIYKSEDYGTTWQKITNGITNSPVNVIKEDPVNPNILYAGTDDHTYVSMDQGASWQPFSKNLPNVAIHDLVIHPEAGDIILGTHGRSIYKADVKALQLLDDNILAKEVHIFPTDSIKHNKDWGNSWSKWLEAETPSLDVQGYFKSPGKAKVVITNKKGVKLYSFNVEAVYGINQFKYDLSVSEEGRKVLLAENKELDIEKKKNDKYYLPKGAYQIEISRDKQNSKEKFTIY
ncbi:glycosyl hydrolase [Aquimarina sp. ERC-38]|uniref:VPS10 domain-containing protein n=1 Tax=Aquimarina sp. ERC-38 TaxID=2949996 RepID=UPI0022463BD4|nr:glycosyl hydrolase [Aquimarina sp. ERC-38]UZO81793.1 glycosyl hydrolase [Aquimarina sp. ERC-38]